MFLLIYVTLNIKTVLL